MGKRAWLACSDPIPPRYAYLMGGLTDAVWEDGTGIVPQAVVAVDIADTKLFGEKLRDFADKVQLCIDHHGPNTGYAKYLLLRPNAAANCELMLDLLEAMGLPLTEQIANCLYTGLVTDTGCFRHSSTTVDSHRAAEKLLQAGADMRMIHRLAFESVSRGKVALLVEAMQQIHYELDGRCAILVLPRDRINALGVADDELEGIAALPRQIEGVQASPCVSIKLPRLQGLGAHRRHYRRQRNLRTLKRRRAPGRRGCNVEELPLEEVYRRVLRSVEQELAGN